MINKLLTLEESKERFEKAESRSEAVRVLVELFRQIRLRPLSLAEISNSLGLGLERKRSAVTLDIREALTKRFGKATPAEEKELSDLMCEMIQKPEITPEVDLGAQVFQLTECLVPPDEGEMRNGTGFYEKPKILPRTRLALEVLESLGVGRRECQIYTGQNHRNMVRGQSYRAIVATKIDRMVLVCDEEGNRTFVIYTSTEPARFWRMTKKQLKTRTGIGEVADLEWCEPEVWKLRLAELLTKKPEQAQPQPATVPTPPPTPEKPHLRKMDAAYFSNPESVRYDLEAFAKDRQCKVGELSTKKMEKSKKAPCANREAVNGNTYLKRARAAVELGRAKGDKEAVAKLTETLDSLKRRIGIDVPERREWPAMDGAYFADTENVRNDLEAFAKDVGCKVGELSTTHMQKSKKAACANGEMVNGRTYIRRASVGLGLAKGHIEAESKTASALDSLKRRIGIDVPERREWPAMDGAYFADTENVRNDLEAFAKDVGCKVGELSTSKKGGSKKAPCANGEAVNWQTYLTRATIGLGVAKNTIEAGSKGAEALDALKRRIGIDVPERREWPAMDGAYFADPNNIRRDLEAFAKGQKCEAEDLSTSKMLESKKVSCANGEPVNGDTYLRRAAVGLGLAEDRKGARARAETLDALKRKISIEIPERREWPAMDGAYFAKAANVQRDLEAFASARGCSTEKLSKNKMNKTKKSPCTNGEAVNGNTYLHRAAIGLGLARNSVVASSKLAKTLKKLKEIALAK